MTTIETEPAARPDWHDRVSDWFNAILIKEVRQALKSRLFVAVFMLLLAISWIVAVFLILNFGDGIEFSSTVGRWFFFVFFGVLAFAANVIVPFNAFRSLQSERDQNTYDLLSITSLSPRQIVWGKLFSSFVQLFIFYSAVTPFIAFSSLLQGFSAPTAAVILVGTMLLSMFLSMTTLMASTLASSRAIQGMIALGILIGLLVGFFGFIGRVGMLVWMDRIAVADPLFWWATAFVVAAGTSYAILFQRITIAQLTFESDNRSTGIRVVASAQFWLLWAAYLTYVIVRGEPLDRIAVLVLATFSGLHWAVVGLFAATEGDHLSRRIRREIPHNRLWRFLKTPLMPGGARGYLYVLGHVAALWLIVVALQATMHVNAGGDLSAYLSDLQYMQSSSWTMPLRATTAVCSYVVIYLGIAAAMGRWGRAVSTDVKPAHVRVLTFLLFTAGLIFPLVLRVTELVKSRDYALCDITNPYSTYWIFLRSRTTRQVPFDFSQPRESLAELVGQRGYIDVAPVLLMLMAALMVLVNVPAMISGVRDLSKYVRKKAPLTKADVDAEATPVE